MIGPGPSTRPYLIRALHDWCTDNGFTPYLAVYVDETVQVPTEYVKNREIVLNVGFEATSGLRLGNEFVEFKARFGGVARDILVPVDHVVAIYARENGQGMAFPVPGETPVVRPAAGSGDTSADVTPGEGPQALAARQGTTPDMLRDGQAVASPAADPSLSKVVRLGVAPAASPASGRPERKPAATPRGAGDEPPSPPKGRPPLKRVK